MMEHLDRSFALISLNSSERQWRIWQYECTDLPIHMHPVWFLPGQECGFCSQVEKLEKSLGNDQPRESTENWPNYISKHRLFDSLEAMLNAVEADNGGDERRYLPSQLAKSVSFNKKLGTAFFRQGIPPNKELPMNAGGGNFQLLLLDTPDSPELTKFDQIVLATLKAAKEMDELLLQAINGFFIRCEVKRIPTCRACPACSNWKCGFGSIASNMPSTRG